MDIYRCVLYLFEKVRVCKVYSKVDGEWNMTMHTGVLEY